MGAIYALLGRDARERVPEDAEVQRGLAAAEAELLPRVDHEGIRRDGERQPLLLHEARGGRVVGVLHWVGVRQRGKCRLVEVQIVASAIAKVVVRDGRVMFDYVVARN